ncbi:hypothetical protein ACIPW5_06715 [Streptomyces sp. NPDC090077]|uniref:DUF7507 domain-containing protein n=1 Tax=Streptomyces sp. NPDC090077 TaxID=3365938 RepID=UPI003802EF8B
MAQDRRSGMRRALIGAAVALVLATTGAGTAVGSTGPAAGKQQVSGSKAPGAKASRSTKAVCPPGPIWANTGGNARRLFQYDSDGNQLSSAPLAHDYGDIAFTGDGSTLYGVGFPGSLTGTTLYTVNPVTGAETASVQITGPIASIATPGSPYSNINALSARADGTLLAGSFSTSQIYVIDPATGVSSNFSASFPAGFTSAGDFLALDDGDILAFATPAGGNFGTPSAVFRIHPDNTVTQIGTMPQIFGAAQSGNLPYGFGSGGDIIQLTSLPTAPSTDPLPVTIIASPAVGFYGGTSAQDAGTCPAPAYTVEKSASTAGPVNAGDTVTYTVKVTNTGTAVANGNFTDDLSGILDDATLVPGSVTATSGTAQVVGNNLNWTGVLQGGAVATITYQVQVNNPAAGNLSLANTVTPTAEGGSCATASGCTVTIPVNGTRSITIVKEADEDAFTAVGQTVHYSYLVTNTGTVPVSSLTVSDNGPGTPQVSCPVTTLAPGASTTCTASHVTTAADVTAGKVVNTATGNGTTPGGTPVTGGSNTVTVPYAGMKVVKSALESSFSGAGQTLHYNFTVTNTGQTTLNDLDVTDNAPGTPDPKVTCPVDTLAPGASTVCTATYTTTAADVVAGKVDDVAAATTTTPGGTPVTGTSNPVSVPAVGTQPKLKVEKDVEETAYSAPGQLLHYTFTVTNVGTVPVSGISVTDIGPGNPPVSCPATTLAPGESTICTATYTTTEADMESGRITDVAKVIGTGPNGQPANATSNTVTIVSCAPCQDHDHGGCNGDHPQGKPHQGGKPGKPHMPGKPGHGWDGKKKAHKA